ncbi:MAG: PP2C family protein-serine/threonine phosphatase [Candidatus Eisenbacteria bacterium]|uniref:PP2C family protein-serine/threonine phosphatase n=1 Tax=Eiseniibacteriota bacterium TaxID=2212470 RepID=A0A933W4H9_UNCEI|nr:PP2C family protein-serine/threonine phosphatase [Candidatus Eisenbacteria bacterium]
MIRFVSAVLLALLTARAHRGEATRDEAARGRARARFALSFLVQVAALLAFDLEAGVAALRTPLLVCATLAGVVAWEAFAQLLATGTRRRDRIARWCTLGVAFLLLATPAPWGVAGAFLAMGSLAFRWRHTVPTRNKYLLAVAAIVLAVLGFLRFGGAGEAGSAVLTAAQHAWWDTAHTLRLALAIASSAGAFVLLLAIVNDPSLGIRGVGRRLALSHLLVVLVPTALLLVLWAAVTVLGVNRDRALVGARAMQSEGERLATAVERAASAPDPAAALDAVALAWNAAGSPVTVYAGSGRELELRRGPAVPGGVPAVAAWCDSIGTFPRWSWVRAGEGLWVAATVSRPGARWAVFVPGDSIVRRDVAAVAGGRASVVMTSRSSARGGAGVTVLADSLEAIADSLENLVDGENADRRLAQFAERARVRADSADSVSRRNRPNVSLNVGQQTYRVDEGNMSARAFLLEGHAFVPSLRWRGAEKGWDRGQLMLTIGVPPNEVLRGLFHNSEDDPMGYVPLVLLVTLGGLMALVALWDIVMVTNMGRNVAAAIGALHGAARKLESGELSHRIEIRGEDDLWAVARAMNQASEGLEHARSLEKERARMESELALARRIQARLLPAMPPSVPGLEIAGASEAAREVGGDYFDHLDLGDRRVGLVIADVSGKGVPAALLMSAFRAALVSHDLGAEEPAALATRLNEFLHKSVDPGKFVTAFLGFLDAGTGELHYVNAGHNPSLLVRADGTHEWLSEGGTILGILPFSVFTSGRVKLEVGDVLTLYTDGVTEGADAANEQWGEDRLVEAVKRLHDRPCKEIAQALVREVRTFEGDTGPADDLTVIVARRVV